MLNARFVRIYVVPGAVYQSVMVGGGYGTGREIVEYFTSYGMLGGALGLLIAFATLAVVLSLTFEVSRVFGAYDYRNFFKVLLGRGWFVYEILIVLFFLLVLAVVAAAAGNILSDNFGISYYAGIGLMLIFIGVLTFYGRELVAKALTFWSLYLYLMFISFFALVVLWQGDAIGSALAAREVHAGWAVSGFKYALYNLAAVPLLLYVARGFRTRSETLLSGLAAAAIALLPALISHFSFLAAYPQIVSQAIPIYWLLTAMGASVFMIFYSIMLFGTFVETGAGMLQGINDRLDAFLTEKRGRGLSRLSHAAIAMTAMLVSAILSAGGIVRLIADGYGAMAWGFFAVYVVPLITIGVFRLSRGEHNAARNPV